MISQNKKQTMTPQEKAKELVEKFAQFAQADWDDLNGYNKRQELANAKQCALIAVDEIMIAIKFTNDSKWYVEQHNEWQQVKQEIEKLKAIK